MFAAHQIGTLRLRRKPSTTMNPMTWVLAPLLPDPVRRRMLERERRGFDKCGFPAPTPNYADRCASRVAQLEYFRHERAAGRMPPLAA